jgi:hypothetical protein
MCAEEGPVALYSFDVLCQKLSAVERVDAQLLLVTTPFYVVLIIEINTT